MLIQLKRIAADAETENEVAASKHRIDIELLQDTRISDAQ